MFAWKVSLIVAAPLAVLAVLVLSPSRSADAFIHEKIAAACRAGGEEVQPPGQLGESKGNSFIRALQATGLIESIDTSVAGQVTIHFNPDVPSSKFRSTGHDVIIPDGVAPGVNLILSPGLELDPNFPAFANCHNLNP